MMLTWVQLSHASLISIVCEVFFAHIVSRWRFYETRPCSCSSLQLSAKKYILHVEKACCSAAQQWRLVQTGFSRKIVHFRKQTATNTLGHVSRFLLFRSRFQNTNVMNANHPARCTSIKHGVGMNRFQHRTVWPWHCAKAAVCRDCCCGLGEWRGFRLHATCCCCYSALLARSSLARGTWPRSQVSFQRACDMTHVKPALVVGVSRSDLLGFRKQLDPPQSTHCVWNARTSLLALFKTPQLVPWKDLLLWWFWLHSTQHRRQLLCDNVMAFSMPWGAHDFVMYTLGKR